MIPQFQPFSERRTPPRGQLPALDRLLATIIPDPTREIIPHQLDPRAEESFMDLDGRSRAPGAEEETRRRLEMGEPKDEILRRIQELLMDEDSVFQRHGKAMERGLMTRDPEGREKTRKVTPETFMPNLRRWWGYPYNEGGYL
jgi:hypothetical protein